MWKIYIEYSDKSKATLTGKHEDIPLRLAVKYFNEYVAGKACKATYQRYPKNKYAPVDLYEKIEQLQGEKEELLCTTKPILFNTKMVRAILEGRKTVTRRVLKLPSHIQSQDNGLFTLYADGTCYENERLVNVLQYLKAPYKVNDILYVRETWYKGLKRILYKANYAEGEKFYTNGKETLIKWKPSIHMPKEAARIFLRVTDVRVERLQDMSTKEDFKKEGIYDDRSVKIHPMAQGDWTLGAYKDRFEMIWNSTIKRDQFNTYSWSANPYVWVIEFERVFPEVIL